MANKPHPATCGTCGGSGIVYKQTTKYRTTKITDPYGGTQEETVVEEILQEKTCGTCNGKGTR